MDLRILEIASNTENNKVLDNFTHQSKNKNPICGDEMEISLMVKNDTVVDIGYQCKSCVYCQASVSLLSQKIKNKKLQEIKNDYDKQWFGNALSSSKFTTSFNIIKNKVVILDHRFNMLMKLFR